MPNPYLFKIGLEHKFFRVDYKKSLELNPKNANAIKALASFSGETKEAGADLKVYEAYAGDYELSPNFIITISVTDRKLMSQATGQAMIEIYPSSATEFFLKVVDAQLTFVKDEKGQVTQLILHQNGANMPAKKIR